MKGIASLRRHPVLVIGSLAETTRTRLERFFELECLDETPGPGGLRQRMAGKAALLTASEAAIDEDFLEGMRWLRAICRSRPGAGGIDLEACTRAGILVTAIPPDMPATPPDGMSGERAADNLIAAFGFGRIGGHPPDLLNPEVRCQLGCCG
jgi:lactate dehydrogenase-like 2-hydroxyacid dehydrogenase